MYRCFGWTPTSPIATPQYDWERTQNEIKPAEKFTSADISPNLQDYDDLGLQRKELIAIKRNTKFYQYDKKYRGFFLYESVFDTLMHRYTVDKKWKRVWLIQLIYRAKRPFDILMRILLFIATLLFLAVGFMQVATVAHLDSLLGSLMGIEIVKTIYTSVEDFYQEYLLASSLNQMIASFALSVLFFLIGSRQVWITNKKLNKKRQRDPAYYFEGRLRTPELLKPLGATQWRKNKTEIVNRFAAFLYIPALFFLALGVYMSGLLADMLPKDILTSDTVALALFIGIGAYLLCGYLVHRRTSRDANPFALIQWLCLQARPVTKKILMTDMSMMTPQQRQRYQQGRVIGSAVSDALDRRERGISDDLYIGY